MQIATLSGEYKVRVLTPGDSEKVYELCKQNTLYYQYCPPFVTLAHVQEDMEALPPGKTLEDKYYVGFFEPACPEEGEEKLVAVMDLIDHYPEPGVAFIGFFMMDHSLQGRGAGTRIISHLCQTLQEQGYQAIRLCWVIGNLQAEHFWKKNGFVPIRETKSTAAERVILAERTQKNSEEAE